jgi:basic membrane protein A
MKKVTLLVIVLVMATTLFAQGGKEVAAADSRPTIRLLTDATGIDDKSFNAAAWRGIVQYYGDTVENAANRGKLYDVVTAQTQDMYIPNLRQASDEGYDLIMVTGFTWADALSEVAPQYPDQKYTIVDVDWVGLPNVLEFIYSEEQGSYLVGLAAALQAKEDGIQNPKFGFIGGVPGATITKFEMGYVQAFVRYSPMLRYLTTMPTTGVSPNLRKHRRRTGTTWVSTASSAQPAEPETAPLHRQRNIVCRARTSGRSV